MTTAKTNPDERDVNNDPTGAQMLRTSQSLAALPGGGALLGFVTAPLGGGAPTVRYAVLETDGHIRRTCLNEMEVDLAANADLPVVAVPATEDQQSMIAYITGGAVGPILKVRSVSASGCLGEGGVGNRPFVVRPEKGYLMIRTLTAVSLGNNRFALAWVELEGQAPAVQTRIMGAVVEFKGGAWNYVPSAVGPDFGLLPIPGDQRGLVMMAKGPDSTIAVAWFDIRYKAVIVRFAVLDPLLNVVVPAHDVYTRKTDTMELRETNAALSLAYDPTGGQYLVAWVLGDATDAPRVFGRFLDPQARPLRSQRGPNGEAFPLGSLTKGSETDIAVESLREGGFLAAWHESKAEGREDGDGLRAVAFDAGGNVRFSNRTCQNGDFAPHRDLAGSQRRPLLVRLIDDTMLLVFENEGGVSADRSGSGIRAHPLRPWDMFAIEGPRR